MRDDVRTSGQKADRVLDSYLVLHAQSGDAAALTRLYQLHGPRIQALAMRQSGFERELAQDAAQEAWIAIAKGIHRLKDPARFFPWAASIAANKVKDQIRRRARAQEQVLSDAEALPQLESSDEVAVLRRAIHLLPADRRELITLFYYEGFTVAEIADVMGIAPGTVKSRLYHAREALKHILERSSS